MDFFKEMIRVEKWPSHFQLPKLQSHRGYCLKGARENTLQAFREAKKMGAQMFECDCQLSRDQIPIIFHDENLQRLGQDSHLVRSLTARQLKEKVQAPSLQEVLTDLQVPSLINIELKTKTKFDEPLERKVTEVIQKTGTEQRILFSSFNPFSIWRISQFLPQVPRALLVSEENEPGNNLALRKMMLAPFLKIHMLNLHYPMLDSNSLRFWQKAQIPVAAWTVNSPDQIRSLLEKGVCSVISDWVGEL